MSKQEDAILAYIRQHPGQGGFEIDKALGIDGRKAFHELYNAGLIECVYFHVGMGELESPNVGGWYATSVRKEEVARDIAAKIPYILDTWRNYTWPSKK